MRPSKPFAPTLTLVLLAIAAAAGAQGVPVDRVLRDFEASGTYVLTVDGKPVPDAEIYENSSLPAVLLVAPSLQSALVLRPGRATVETVSMAKVAKQPDGAVGLLADAVLEPAGNYRVAGARIAFEHGGRPVVLEPKPPLLGLRNGYDVAEHDPAYVRTRDAYDPSPSAIATLQAAPVPVRVRVYFGSWCPYCKRQVPCMLKVEEALRGSRVAFEYFGLPEPPAPWDEETKRLKVGGVPVALVYVGGKAVGRLNGQDWNTPEVELARIVKTWAVPPAAR